MTTTKQQIIVLKCWITTIPLALGLSLQADLSAQIVSDRFPHSAIAQKPPPPPPKPPPNGTRPGGGLNPHDPLLCNALNRSLRALLPAENPVLTATDSPTFLFYLPFTADQIKYGEFTLLTWPGEQQRLYQVRFTLPKTPGIVSVKLPPQSALQEGQYYRWYLQLYCQNGSGAQPDLTVNGMVQRIALTVERKRQINNATPDVWYDALAQVAAQLQTSPQNSELQKNWRSLLQTIEAEDIAQEPLLGPVIPLKTPSPQQ